MNRISMLLTAAVTTLMSEAVMAQARNCGGTTGIPCDLPEPGSLALLGLGIAAAVAISRWKK